MKRQKLELVRGSGNVFRDLGHKSADVEQFKAILAAEIIKALDREGLMPPAPRTDARELPLRTFLASAMRISHDLRSIASCRSLTGSARGLK